jgi:hypothetical protein
MAVLKLKIDELGASECPGRATVAPSQQKPTPGYTPRSKWMVVTRTKLKKVEPLRCVRLGREPFAKPCSGCPFMRLSLEVSS